MRGWLSLVAAAVFGAAPAALVAGEQEWENPFFRRVVPRAAPADVKPGVFNQWIDHAVHSKGSFKQRYWYNDKYWGGPGSPIFLFNAGETIGYDASNFTYFLDETHMAGYYAKQFKGAAILIEHRYYGESFPESVLKTGLTTETLQDLTLPNSMLDMVNFAKTVKLDFDRSGKSNADSAPWVLMGCSYSGALAAWTEQKYPGTFWAYSASSAPVETIYDFWAYYEPIAQSMPKQCRAKAEAAITEVDLILGSGDQQAIKKLLKYFSFDGEAVSTFVSYLSRIFTTWQSEGEGPNDSKFWDEFCGYLTTATTPLGGYAQYMINTQKSWNSDDCDSNNVNCDYRFTSDIRNFDGQRQWSWMLCNEPFGYWQSGQPVNNGTSVISSHLTADWWYSVTCDVQFPRVNGFMTGAELGFTEEHTSLYSRGWTPRNPKRVIFIDGELDPWRSASVSSDFRTGGPLKSTNDAPVFVIPGSNHCRDSSIDPNGHPDRWAVQKAAVGHMQRWLKEYYSTHQ